MTDRDLVNAVYIVAAVAFLSFIFVGAAAVTARVAYYRAHGYRRPRLLTRDVIDRGGFALSFGLILIGRAIDVPGRTELPWTLATSIPAIVGAATFVYFELFVIERSGRRPSDDRRRSTDHAIDPSDDPLDGRG